jgi:hypothetical protein
MNYEVENWFIDTYYMKSVIQLPCSGSGGEAPASHHGDRIWPWARPCETYGLKVELGQAFSE